MSVCVCLAVCVSVYTKAKKIMGEKTCWIQLGRVRHWALFDQGQGRSMTFLLLQQYKLLSPISQV